MKELPLEESKNSIECNICYYKKHDLVSCIYCGYSLCNDCCKIITTTLNHHNKKYKCPQCRKIQHNTTHMKKMFSYLKKNELYEITNLYVSIRPNIHSISSIINRHTYVSPDGVEFDFYRDKHYYY